ncbi:MAG: hypothetical protein J1E35_03010 [Lachnospiraceae bacterium]|nr:hypothetical protein [Lachnospiraceae bacterium]
MKGIFHFRPKEKDGVHFHSRKRSGKGTAGFVLAIICVLAFLVLCVISAVAGGNAGDFIGVAGLAVAALCIIAFWLSLQGLRERDVYTKLPFAGLLVAGVLFVWLFCLYIIGIRF